jgi:hypothetical protein
MKEWQRRIQSVLIDGNKSRKPNKQLQHAMTIHFEALLGRICRIQETAKLAPPISFRGATAVSLNLTLPILRLKLALFCKTADGRIAPTAGAVNAQRVISVQCNYKLPHDLPKGLVLSWGSCNPVVRFSILIAPPNTKRSNVCNAGISRRQRNARTPQSKAGRPSLKNEHYGTATSRTAHISCPIIGWVRAMTVYSVLVCWLILNELIALVALAVLHKRQFQY